MEDLDNDMTQILRCESAGNDRTTKHKKHQFLIVDKCTLSGSIISFDRQSQTSKKGFPDII